MSKTPNSSNNKLKEGIQKFGRFFSGMILPNIGAFIAWGLITALFIGPGWMPNEKLATMVGPMLKALLPILIGYSGGRMVGGQRGAVVGAVATFGIMIGSGGDVNLADGTPMLLGAMLVGPLGGYLVKKLEKAIQGKIPAGFEMLVNNLSDGILGMILACAGLLAFGPVVMAATNAFGTFVKGIVEAGLLPLASLAIEPAKILFLNNAINHGVLTPLGVEQVGEIGKSIFFMLESNPGPGLGILLAYFVFSKGIAKESSPAAILIHFFGGIHEIYFPYVLMNPAMLLAVIGGGMSGVLTFSALGAGLVGPPAPGSILMYLAMTPKGGLFPVLAGVIVSTVVSFLIGAVLIKRSKEFSGEELDEAKSTVKNLKAKSKKIATSINKIVFACDAGMGSSAMGATTLRNRLKKMSINVEVEHFAIDDIPKNTQLVITHESLSGRARSVVPQAEIYTITNFMDSKQYDELVKRLA